MGKDLIKSPSQIPERAIKVIRLGFEPKTHSLEGCCSIQLSYRTDPCFAFVVRRADAESGCKYKSISWKWQIKIVFLLFWRLGAVVSVEAVVSHRAHDGNAGSSVNQWLLRRSYEFSPAQGALIVHPKEREPPFESYSG